MVFFFFFQAEDGIRDGRVTGVQTCALPIWPRLRRSSASSAGTPWPRKRNMPVSRKLASSSAAVLSRCFASAAFHSARSTVGTGLITFGHLPQRERGAFRVDLSTIGAVRKQAHCARSTGRLPADSSARERASRQAGRFVADRYALTMSAGGLVGEGPDG